jgi:hypothetical protein
MDTLYYKGEVGRTISQTTGFDWTSNTAKQVIIEKPSGETITKTGSDVSVDDAATGQIHVTVAAGELDEAGEYMFQAKCTISSVVKFGPMMHFFVEDVLTASA